MGRIGVVQIQTFITTSPADEFKNFTLPDLFSKDSESFALFHHPALVETEQVVAMLHRAQSVCNDDERLVSLKRAYSIHNASFIDCVKRTVASSKTRTGGSW